MQRQLMLLVLGVLFAYNNLPAQYCPPGTYLYNQYTTARDSGVYYGSAINYRGDTVDLHMNIYYPTNDTLVHRPLIVWVHGGGFQGGSYLSGTIHQLCDSFAARGYVTATIQYRLGFWREYDAILGLFGEPYGYDINEFQRAIVRATQDVKGAIRYLKGNAAQYKIDTNWVFAGGESAGGFTALHVGYMDEQDRPSAADPLIDMEHKDLFGNVLFRAERPNLGTVEGTLNLNGTSSKVQGVLNIYGALLDTNFISDANDPALHQYYVLDDPLVACGTSKAFHQAPALIFPFSGNTKNPLVSGPCYLEDRANNLNFTPLRHRTWIRPSDPFGSPPVNPHGIGGGALTQYIQDVAGWLDTLICQECDSTDVVQFTDQVTALPGGNALLTVQANGQELEFTWSHNGQIVGTGDSLWLNGLTPADTGLYILEITNRCGKTISRNATLSLITTGIRELLSESIAISPNPASTVLTIRDREGRSLTYQITDMSGRTTIQGTMVGTANLDLTKLPNGIYFVRLKSENESSAFQVIKTGHSP